MIKRQVKGQSRVGIFAIKDIAKGDELTFDYQFERKGKQKQRCFCGASNCRGFLGEKKKKAKKTSSSSSSGDSHNDPTSPTSPTPSAGRGIAAFSFDPSHQSGPSSANSSCPTSPLGSPKMIATRRTSSNSASEPGSPVPSLSLRSMIDSGLREKQISIKSVDLPDKMADHYQRLCTILGLTEPSTEEGESMQRSLSSGDADETKDSKEKTETSNETEDMDSKDSTVVDDSDEENEELISAESWRKQRLFVQVRRVFLVRNLVSTVNWLLDQQDPPEASSEAVAPPPSSSSSSSSSSC